jgi:predicted double-glycine peptidase
MTENKSNTALKILTGILAVALIALGIYTVKFYNEEKENQEILTKEKAVIEDELNDLIIKYDDAIANNEVMDQNLVDARQRISVLLDSVKDSEANLVLISRYRREIGALRNEKDRLFKVVDSLSNQNRLLATTIDSTNTVLAQRTRFSDSLQQTNQSLSTKVDRAAQLKVTALKGEGVIVRNNGKLVTNNRTRRIDQIRTCFTITANPLSDAGEKQMYVQVYNPENELVGDQMVVNHDGGAMVYSGSSKVFYENEELDVCMLSNTDRDKLMEGTYKVYVYAGPQLIGTSSFNLR